MPITTIPLAFSPDQRGPIISSASAPTKDARMVRCIVTAVDNALTKTRSLYVEKIPGFASSSTPGGSNSGTAIFVTQAIQTVAAFGSASTVYVNGVDITAGDSFATTAVSVFTNGFLNGIEYIFWQDAGVPWYLPVGDSHILDTAYTADGNNSTTITDIKRDGNSDTDGLYPGQVLSAATNIQAGTRVVSVDSSARTAVLSLATTGGAFNDLAITKKPIAFMNNAAFFTYLSTTGGALAGNFVEMDGYVFITATATEATNYGVILQSDQNTVSFTPNTNFIAPNYKDLPSGVIKYRDYLVYFGVDSIQFFRNAGNPSGSVLSQVDELSIVGFGCVGGSGNSGPMMTALAGNIYWMGLTKGVISGVYRMNGFSPEPISTDAVTRQLSAVIAGKQSSDVVAFDGFSMFGKHFLYIGLGSIGYLYCVETNQWTEAGFFSGGMRLANSLASTANPILYGVRMTGATGKIYVMDKTNLTYQDDSAAYTMRVQTGRLALNQGKSFTIKAVRGINWDNQSSGNSTISTFTDDFTTEQLYGAVSLTDTKKEIKKQRFVKSGAVAFSITDSGNNAWRGEALEVEWEPSVT